MSDGGDCRTVLAPPGHLDNCDINDISDSYDSTGISDSSDRDKHVCKT